MTEKATATAKTAEIKKANPISQSQRTERPEVTKSPMDRMLNLHKTIGNQAVQRLFRSGVIQAKLRTDQPNDVYEQEADRVAHVVQQASVEGNSAVTGSVQRQFGFFWPFWPTRSTEGGIADVTNLEQDMRFVLQEWRDAAADGANLFAFDALSKRIDALESGSWNKFWVSLIGNTIWALAVFNPPGAVAFAISMAGVAVAASPTVPSKSKSKVGLVARQLQNHIYEVYDQLNKGLRNSAEVLIMNHADITRYRALDMFMEASFKRQFYLPPVRYDKIPNLSKERIRDWYMVSAELRLRDAEGYTERELEEYE